VNWSSSTMNASAGSAAPSSHARRSPASASSISAPKRSRICASNCASLRNHSRRAAPWPASPAGRNQKSSTACASANMSLYSLSSVARVGQRQAFDAFEGRQFGAHYGEGGAGAVGESEDDGDAFVPNGVAGDDQGVEDVVCAADGEDAGL